MKCPNCQTICLRDAKFCQQCGRNLRIKAFEVSKQAGPTDAQRYTESMVAYNKLLFKKRKIAAIVFTTLVTLAGLMYFVINFEAWFWVIVVALVLGAISVQQILRMSESNYYSLPHSSDAGGNHRCLWCGNKGIWRKGEYRSNNTHSHCSKCKEYLYTE